MQYLTTVQHKYNKWSYKQQTKIKRKYVHTYPSCQQPCSWLYQDTPHSTMTMKLLEEMASNCQITLVYITILKTHKLS